VGRATKDSRDRKSRLPGRDLLEVSSRIPLPQSLMYKAASVGGSSQITARQAPDWGQSQRSLSPGSRMGSEKGETPPETRPYTGSFSSGHGSLSALPSMLEEPNILERCPGTLTPRTGHIDSIVESLFSHDPGVSSSFPESD
jgi:hypothetical protein